MRVFGCILILMLAFICRAGAQQGLPSVPSVVVQVQGQPGAKGDPGVQGPPACGQGDLDANCQLKSTATALTTGLSGIISSTLPIYTAGGASRTPSHSVIDSCTLALGVCTVTLTGSAAFSSAITYTCTSSDQNVTATLSSIINVSGVSFTIKGTLSDIVRYTCTGW